ncbi:hypothetical protein EWM64_g3220 [Hericium alpestre]|uniref:Uncharacterized protein n=1 Tax=Hericium alpestre TaxID=135208 RepID=A0A4Z0A118_9AGAM|nr:hypothetical protein EWM64_g3220 [Hericium alpestre]
MLNDDGRATEGEPLRISTTKKRSSSPFDEDRAGASATDSRELKRPRKDDDEDLGSSLPTKIAGPFDFAHLSPAKSKFSLQHSPPDTPRRRAVSVPPTPPHVPHLDLKKIASPHKSPSKPSRPQFRFTSEPRVLRDPFSSDEMEVDPHDVEMTPHGPGPDANALLTPHFSRPSPPSPLTPLPATPFPMKTPLSRADLGSNSEESIDDPFQITDESRTPIAAHNAPEINVREPTPKAVAPVDIPATEPTPEPSTSAITPSTTSFSRIPRPSSSAARPSSRTSESSVSSVGPSSGLDSEPPAAPAPPAPARKPTSRASRGRRAPGNAPPARLTRSASQKQKKQDSGTDVGPSKPIASTSTSRPTTPGLSKKSAAFSFAMPTSSSLSKAVEKSPTKKPVSLPKPQSPTKLFAKKPASQVGYAPKNSSLSNLSMALEKLKMPPPSRPGTSMGFMHRDNPPAASLAKDDGDGAQRERRRI